MSKNKTMHIQAALRVNTQTWLQNPVHTRRPLHTCRRACSKFWGTAVSRAEQCCPGMLNGGTRRNYQINKHCVATGSSVRWLSHSGSTFYPPKYELKFKAVGMKSRWYTCRHAHAHKHAHAHSSQKEVTDNPSFLKVTELMTIKGQLVHFSTCSLLLPNWLVWAK